MKIETISMNFHIHDLTKIVMFLYLFGLPFIKKISFSGRFEESLSFVTMFWVLKYTFKDVSEKPGERTPWLRVFVDLPEGKAGF